MSIFSKIGLIDQSKPCTQIYLPKNANCINLQLAIRIWKITLFGHALPHNRHLGQFWDQSAYYISSYHKKTLTQTDGRQTARRTARRTDGMTQTIGSFFNNKKILKQMHAMRTSIFCCARMYSGNSARLNKKTLKTK